MARDPFSVRLFGGPALFGRGEEICLSPQQRCLLSLIYGSDLQGSSRDQIISVLWPQGDPLKARRRLNQLIYGFRKRAGDHSIIHTPGDRIEPAREEVASDLTTFRNALDSGDFSTSFRLLEQGFAPLTADFPNRAYTGWIQSREAELRRELRRKAESEWNRKTLGEGWGDASAAAAVLLQLFPNEERRLQALMEAHTRTGRLTEALEAYNGFLERNGPHDWSPNPDTVRLWDLARSLNESTVMATVPDHPQAPFTGRDPERRTLRRTLSSAPPRDLRTVLVSGEAGIGKTRLIQEVLPGLPLDGHEIFFSEAAELEKLIPLNPLIEALKGETTKEVLQGLDEPWRTVLYGIMPAHYPGEGPIPEAPHIQPGSVPRRLFEAIYQLLLAHVERTSVILVLEDLQWADETSLSVLEFLIRRWDHGGLQLLLSIRTEEVRRNPVLERFLENLRLQAQTVEISLSELAPEYGETLIQLLSSRPLERSSVALLQSLAGGNPFFLIELTLEFLAGRLGPISAPQDLVPIPISIRQVLDRRLSELRSEADRVLSAMAVNGRPLGLLALESITELSQSECLAGLDQLNLFRLVASHGGSEVMISHELVRQTVYQSLTPTRRSWLHDRIGRYLQEARPTTPPDELAIHFHHAGAKEEARAYASEAADRAEASGAVSEALRFLRIARENSEDPETVADLIGKMGHLNYRHQNLEEAAPLLELAAQRFRRQRDHAKALKAEVEWIDCLGQIGPFPITESLEELGRLKEEARSKGEWGVFTKALDVEAHRFDHHGDQEGVRAVLRQAQTFADLGTAEARCRARAILALNVYYGSAQVALAAAREAVEIAMQTHDTDLQLHALNRLIVVLLYQGRLHTMEGESAFEMAESRLRNCGDLILKFFIKLNRAVWHLEVAEFDRSSRAFDEVEPVIRGTSATDAHAVLFLNKGELGLAMMAMDEARESFERAHSYLKPNSPKAFSMIINSGLGLCALKSGNIREAREREAMLPTLPVCWTFDPSVIISFKARMFGMRGDQRSADRIVFETARDVKGRLVTPWIRMMIERAQLKRGDDPRSALELLEETIKTTEDLRHVERTRQLKRLLKAWGGRSS